MSSSIAERYLELFQNDQPIRLALLACSAALQLDDETACEAVDLVARTNDSSYTLMRRVKKLGCVWKEWDGFWYVAEDVRRGLLDWIYRELPEPTIVKLRQLFANAATSRAAQITSNDQAAAHERMVAQLEAAYHRVLIPGQTENGASELIELWRQLPSSDREALAVSVDYLADELDQRLGRLPDEIVFLRGMAAGQRGDSEAQERYFDLVWKSGYTGEHADIHAIAAQFLGELIQQRDPQIQVPETWTEDGAVTIEDLRASVHQQAYDFAVTYYRRRRTGPTTDTSTLTDELYMKFFEPHPTAWPNRAEFYVYVAQLIRRILVRSARTQYSTKFDSELSRRWNDEFGLHSVVNWLALDKALSILREYDPDQARIVELRFHAGLTLEKIAAVMQLRIDNVEREWRTARAFLKLELTREDIIPQEIIAGSQMTSTASFLRHINQ